MRGSTRPFRVTILGMSIVHTMSKTQGKQLIIGVAKEILPTTNEAREK
jgi:hypothetical protein